MSTEVLAPLGAGGSAKSDAYFILEDAFTPGPLSFTGYTSAETDAALETLRGTTDLEGSKAAVESGSMDVSGNVPNPFTGYVDGWEFPDGTAGNGVPGASTMWCHVWTTE